MDRDFTPFYIMLGVMILFMVCLLIWAGIGYIPVTSQDSTIPDIYVVPTFFPKPGGTLPIMIP